MDDWKKLYRRKDFTVGLIFLTLYIIWGIFWFFYSYIYKGNLDTPYFPTQNIRNELIFPFHQNFILGTDIYGRSVFEMLSSGLLYTLILSFSVSICSAFLGIFIGHFSARGPKIVQNIFDSLTNLVFIFPSILLAILFLSFFDQSIFATFFVLTLTSWPGHARIVRGEIKRIMLLPYVESTVAIGAGSIYLFGKIILRAIIPQLSVHFILTLSGIIVTESALSFLGLGGSRYSWGSMFAMAKGVLLEAPYITLFLSLAMGGLILGLTLLGDALRDHLDPIRKNKAY